jgi:transmembrane sensor
MPGAVTLVAAGNIAQANDQGVLLQTIQLAEVEEALSWRQGVLVFRQMTLADASAEFNRYNTRKIVIEDPNIAGLRVAGSFRANNVEAFVRLLERGYPLRAEEQDDRFVLVAR